MATVRVIPPNKNKVTGPRPEEAPKLKVAAYCRVSTESEEQATSYEAQVKHYTEYITNHPGWQLAGIYADEGISGTNTKKREEFNRLIEDCMGGKIEMVITKSISRFARNTLDCLQYIRELKDKNIPVFFEKENINTMESKGEVLLTIMASLAQQESQSLSQNVRLGLQYRYQEGKVQVCTNRFLGYDKDEEGNLIINPEQAEVVKRIYREFLEGKSYYEIGKGLTADGIKTAAGSELWRASTLRKILMNEKYIGDALLQKTVTTDFLKKKRVVNNGIAPQYYVEDDHEAIIPRHVYRMVQEEMVRRANLKTGTGRKSVYSGKYALSSMVYCGHCGDIYQRTQWLLKGEHVPVWRCVSRLQKRKNDINCQSRTIFEKDLHAAVVEAVNQLIGEKDEMLEVLKQNVAKVVGSSNRAAIAEIDNQLGKLQTEVIKKADARQEFDTIGDEIERLRDQKQKLLLEDAQNIALQQQVEYLGSFLDKQEGGITEYDEALVRKLIEKITVYDDRLVFEFKSGLEIEVKM
ncbi:MAG: recombinase family protein [Solobacterium sp.]|nr:recombinase family protein [Solobacterium sp.]